MSFHISKIGEIISSRFVEAALSAISLMSKYKSASSEVLGPTLKKPETEDADVYIEEYFGRNLPSISAPEAKKLIRERLASFSSHAESDIYLFPTGMNSIFTAHRVLLSQFSERKSVMFG